MVTVFMFPAYSLVARLTVAAIPDAALVASVAALSAIVATGTVVQLIRIGRRGAGMRRTVVATAGAVALAGAAAAYSPATAKSPALADSTRADAWSAMHGEAFAHAKYLAYADQARVSRHMRAARAFTDAAATELTDHFAREADLIGFAPDNTTDLRDAIAGETGEATGLYPKMAARAAAAGDAAAAALLTEIAGDEAAHARDFTAALMAVTTSDRVVSVPAGPVVVPVAITPGPARVSAATATDLRAAMAGEAFAHAKYLRYAQVAQRTGNPALGQLFTRTADVELREHFAAQADLAGLVSPDTRTNLTDAASGEAHEADSMYPDYARQADRAGDPQAATLFREIGSDEKAHQRAFTAAADR
ncbi:ferritin family protein [Nocardia vaccinii]|uniref:ferritin family protein n=1 Tax=Nocardia vaccinii TaxID=1822 RepID=UPI000B009C95|nr:ferritin family protein [Nocardia vaccinii]